MGLSEHECRELDGIESRLARQDPSLAERLRTMGGTRAWMGGSWDLFAIVVLAVVLILALAAAAVTHDPPTPESIDRQETAPTQTCALAPPAMPAGTAGNDVSAVRCPVP